VIYIDVFYRIASEMIDNHYMHFHQIDCRLLNEQYKCSMSEDHRQRNEFQCHGKFPRRDNIKSQKKK